VRANITTLGTRGTDQRIYLDNDWYERGLPGNVVLADNVYIDTSYGFDGFRSKKIAALIMEEGSGSYDRSSFMVGEEGKVRVGKFTILNGTNIICKKSITIGSHCMISWNTVITDSWSPQQSTAYERASMLKLAGNDALRSYPFFDRDAPVVMEDNCWVGFGAVILPGVRLGRGCIVGCKSIITDDVPPYAIVSGCPPRIIRFLDPDDTEEYKQKVYEQFL
jgi:acetyltransferase-like isoleucine patch superfamily enzyme